ncbi:hypothetical protein CASFOL_013464 [Castilleja foliolosa]|uniref:UMP kinase n=1 Tax=Castilleja foliolosa TaxID=1961234 RepID=A0ABD3DNP2_9LAMI
MASCDDDFSLLDDHHHTPNSSQPSGATQTPSPYPITPFDPDIFDSEPDSNSLSVKRSINRDDFRSGTSKRTRMPSAGEYKKDRDEWSDVAIACLLEAYGDKFVQLSRGILRGRDWEEVAAIVSERCEMQTKSLEQCKNKVDNLKKRFKLERHRMSSSGVSVSHWPWFKQMEQIVGSSAAARSDAEGEKPSDGGGGSSKPQIPAVEVISVKKSLTNLRWRRVVFKISGGALAGTSPNNIDPKVAMLIASEVLVACRVGIEVAIVVGGSNFFCADTWVTSSGFDRCTAYQIGMMATVMNSILLHSALEKLGVQTRVQSAFSMPEVAEPYNRQRAIRHLEKGRVVIFGGIGADMGNPLFSTDTAAALRASEIHADAVIKGANADGNYVINIIAQEHISFSDLASRGASPMDMMALTFCEANGIPAVVIFNLQEPGYISRALCGERVGILIDQTGPVS